MQPDFTPDLVLPFHAYRSHGSDAHIVQDLAPSIAHFYESEKFRGVDEMLRQEVLSAPTPRAARKAARRNKDRWRLDWQRVRARVLRAGLAMQMVESTEARRLLRHAHATTLELSSVRRLGGIPGAFLARAVTDLVEQADSKSTARVGFLTMRDYTPADLNARLDALFQGAPPFSAAFYVGEESDPTAELWCMEQAVPLRYVGIPSQRLRSEDHAWLLKRVNHLVLCAPKSRRAVAELLAVAKKSRIRVLDLSSFTKPNQT